MADDRETPLARWSRLKWTGARTKKLSVDREPAPELETDSRRGGEIVAPEAAIETGHEDASSDLDHKDLPDVSDLNAESDFSAFLREGVSEEIRRKALRVLWRSDPVLANLDGLNDYDEDFRSSGVIAEAVKTAYEAGKGYLDREKEEDGSSPEEKSMPDRTDRTDPTEAADTEVAEEPPPDVADEPKKKSL